MKTLKPKSTVFITAAAIALLTFSAGCKKPAPYNPDYDNSYINSHPTNSGGDIAPVLNGFSPASGLPNTVVKISGYNFDPILANNVVTVGGTTATINAVSAGAIYFTVPIGATTGPMVIKTGKTTLTSAVNFKVLTSTASTYLALPNYNFEHISFAENGDLFGETTTGVYRITSAGNVALYNQPYAFGSLWGSAAYHEQGVYVADRTAGKVLRVATDGLVTLMAGSVSGIADGIGSEAKFNVPIGIALDERGNIYTTDTHRLRQITSAGKVTTIAGNATVGNVNGAGTAAQFGDLQGIAYNDADSSMYVTDRLFLNVRKINISGVVTAMAGSGTKGMVDGPANVAQFVDPVNIVADLSGNLLVADGNSTTGYAIRLINKYGVVSTLLNGPILNAPDGMTVDPQGNVYIMNAGAKNIIKLTIQ